MGRHRSRSRSRSRDRRDRRDRSRSERDRDRSRSRRGRDRSDSRKRSDNVDRRLRERTNEELWTQEERDAVELSEQDQQYIIQGLPDIHRNQSGANGPYAMVWNWGETSKLKKSLEFGLDSDPESKTCPVQKTGERRSGIVVVYGIMARTKYETLGIVHVPGFPHEIFVRESQVGMSLRAGLPLEFEIVSQGKHHTCENVKVLYRTPFPTTQFGSCPGADPPPFSSDTAPKPGEPLYATLPKPKARKKKKSAAALAAAALAQPATVPTPMPNPTPVARVVEELDVNDDNVI